MKIRVAVLMRRLFFIDLSGIFCYTWIVRRIRKRRMVMKLKKAALKAVGKIVNKVTSSTVQDRPRKRCDA